MEHEDRGGVGREPPEPGRDDARRGRGAGAERFANHPGIRVGTAGHGSTSPGPEHQSPRAGACIEPRALFTGY